MGVIKGSRRGKYTTRIIQIDGNVYCWECGKSFKRRAILCHHILTKHLNYRAACPLCDKRLVSVSACNRHLKNVHSLSNYSKFNIELKNDSNSTSETPHHSHPVADTLPCFDQLSFDADKSFPHMANVLSFEENNKFGKHVVAECDIDVGEVILISSGFASIEYLSSINERCFQCGKDHNKDFIKCAHCVNLWFCSIRCCSDKMHKSKCNTTFQASDCHRMRLATEMITVAFGLGDVETIADFCRGIFFFDKKHKNLKPPFSSYYEILRLKGLAEEKHANIAKRVVKCIMLLPQFKTHDTKDFRRMIFNIAYQHVVTIGINVFSEETNVKCGISTRFVMHDVLSRFNHSCSPNIHHVYAENNDTHCVVVRPIKKGDQLFIDYLPGTKFVNDQERQEYIKETWGFTCNCEKCSHMDMKIDIEIDKELHSNYQYILQNFTKLKDRERVLKKCIQFLKKRGYYYSKSVEFITSCFISLINSS